MRVIYLYCRRLFTKNKEKDKTGLFIFIASFFDDAKSSLKSYVK